MNKSGESVSKLSHELFWFVNLFLWRFFDAWTLFWRLEPLSHITKFHCSKYLWYSFSPLLTWSLHYSILSLFPSFSLFWAIVSSCFSIMFKSFNFFVRYLMIWICLLQNCGCCQKVDMEDKMGMLTYCYSWYSSLRSKFELKQIHHSNTQLNEWLLWSLHTCKYVGHNVELPKPWSSSCQE